MGELGPLEAQLQEWREMLMTVRCPHCGAIPGSPCRRPSGAITYIHGKRQNLYREGSDGE